MVNFNALNAKLIKNEVKSINTEAEPNLFDVMLFVDIYGASRSHVYPGYFLTLEGKRQNKPFLPQIYFQSKYILISNI